MSQPSSRNRNAGALDAAVERVYLLEDLERRVFLSATFVPTTTNLHNIQHGPLAIEGGNLADLYLNYRSAQKSGTLPSFESKLAAEFGKAGASLLNVQGTTVGVDVVGSGSLSSLESTLHSLQMSIQSVTPAADAVAGFIPITLLSQLAQTKGVLHVTPLDRPVAYTQGAAPDQADQAMQAVEARSTDGLTGTGVTVGVISDSVSQVGGGLADSIASGDLPKNVKVLNDGPAGSTDEGRAILEEIYDLAPGASLVFDTAGETQQSLASAVTALQKAGCNVIIDDIGYSNEPYFQPGVIDQAINTAVSAGVTYVTAAGNDGTAGFEQAANFVPDPATSNFGFDSGIEDINFNPGGIAATKMEITLNQPTTLTLEWDDAYNGVTGTPEGDLDLNVYDSTGVALEYSGADNVFATGIPIQQVEIPAAGTYDLQIQAQPDSIALPRYYEVTAISNGGSDITSIQYPLTRTSIVGHSGNPNAISTGAVDYANAPPYSSTTPIPTEDFTSIGPVIQSRNAQGNLLPTAQTLDEPNVSGTDGNNNTFLGSTGAGDPNSFPQFFGTSAAAGNVAAAVALLKQAVPTATPAQIKTALEQTAVPVNGQNPDTYNTAAGFGLVDTVAAVAKLETTISTPQAAIVPIVPNPRATPVDSIQIDFNQAVAGFTLADLKLTLNGGSNLLTGAQTLTTSDDTTFELNNLTTLTDHYGQYLLTLSDTASPIVGTTGRTLVGGTSEAIEIEATPGIPVEPANVVGTSNSTSSATITFEEPGAGETGFTLQRATNSLFDGKLINISVPADTTSYTDTGLVPGTVYYYRLDATNADGTSLWSRAATVITLGTGEVILDNNSTTGVTITGDWSTSTAVAGYEGANYLQDDDTNKGTESVKYRPNLSAAGYYDIYATWTTGSDRATKVPFDVFSTTGKLIQTVKVDQRDTGGDGWTLIGEFFLHSSTASFVRIRNSNTDGEVIANAVKFLPVADIERQDGIFNAQSTAAAAAIVRAGPAIAPTSTDNDQLQALHDEVG